MKKISVLIPTYNEQENIVPLVETVETIFLQELSKYDYEIIFIDNFSKDQTKEKIKFICKKNRKVKAIFNAKNFGQLRSPFYGLCQTTGDCAILLCADFQDPPDMIIDFVTEWEKGYKIVIGIKKKSKENPLMYFLRTCYYKLIKKIADIEHIEQFTGFGLYDKAFLDVMRNLEDPMPYFRGIVAELGFERKEIPYEQNKRLHGKTKNNWYSLYDIGMIGITSYSKVVMRTATMLGFICSGISLLIALIYLILKIMYWDTFPMGTAPILIGVFLMGSVQLFFIGLLGEYILNINSRVMKRPLVVEEKRLNFNLDSKYN